MRERYNVPSLLTVPRYLAFHGLNICAKKMPLHDSTDDRRVYHHRSSTDKMKEATNWPHCGPNSIQYMKLDLHTLNLGAFQKNSLNYGTNTCMKHNVMYVCSDHHRR